MYYVWSIFIVKHDMIWFLFQNAMDDREKQHQKIYLEMYRKGQDSARFEREEEVM